MQSLLDVLLPRHCLLCGQASGPANLCSPCLDDLPVRVAQGVCRLPGGGVVWSALDYVNPVDYLVRQFKFGGNQASGRVLADCLARFINEQGRPPTDILMPIPLHGWRHFSRSFNQADVIARWVGRATGFAVYSRVLVRARHTPAQSRLHAAERQANIRGAFRLSGSAAWLRGLRVTLVDDVVTTGATLAECARTLLKGGVTRVDAWTVARAPTTTPR